ncbi:hypothetical protein SAMN02745154_00714 [Mycoplasmopsis verecunda]|uniref:Uncharacterized protein n=1 Tax=Mycoplasmopsis verecunda TaxID=171291 RepID=A0A1T4MJJ8_9BACT|nr:hypothetical protein SAMN02745154_00714 [Mycoplasmopsis verecunda]
MKKIFAYFSLVTLLLIILNLVVILPLYLNVFVNQKILTYNEIDYNLPPYLERGIYLNKFYFLKDYTLTLLILVINYIFTVIFFCNNKNNLLISFYRFYI